MASSILAAHAPDAVEAVAQAIAEHRYRDDLRPSSLEARVLFDADKLDAIGAIGVARACAMAGSRGAPLWAPLALDESSCPGESGTRAGADDSHTPVHEYMVKLRYLSDGMLTETGKKVAKDRHAYMEGFFQRLGDEAEGIL